MDDRLHQTQRTPLVPESVVLLEGLRAAGAVTSGWSGAGPTLLAICRTAADAGAVRDAGEGLLAEHAVPGRALVLAPDLAGLVME
jgi:homoserine kinase